MKIAPTSTGMNPQADQAAARPDAKPARGVEQVVRAKAAREAAETRQAEKTERAETPTEANEKVLERLQEQAGKALSRFGHAVRLQADTSGRVVMQVVDKSSGELIRQFPNEDSLALAEKLDEMRGLLFSSEG